MKKKIFAAVTLCMAALSVACKKTIDDIPILSSYYLEWYIRNGTDKTLYYRYNTMDVREPLLPGDRNEVTSRWVKADDKYADFYKIDHWAMERHTLYIYADETSDDPLHVWTRTERDLPGKQFYNETSWLLVKQRGVFSWTFDITPEDLE